MKKVLIVAISAIFFLTNSLTAQETGFKPSGKPTMKVFSNFHQGLNDNGSAFEIQRAYFGYKANLSENFSAKVLLDVGNPKNGSSLEQTAYLKNAMITYKKGKLTVDFGLIGTKQFKTQEKFWGKRYLYKSFQDKHKFGSSADLGASATYKVHDMVSVDAIVMNGEGYKKLQADDYYRTGAGLTLTPIKGLTVRAYYDFIEGSETQQSIATFVGYKYEKISIAGEYNMQLANKNKEDHDLNGISAYAAYDINKKFQLFGRFDKLSSNTLPSYTLSIEDAWNIKKDGQAIIGGVQYAPIKNLKLALNYQDWKTAGSNETEGFIYMNLEFKF